MFEIVPNLSSRYCHAGFHGYFSWLIKLLFSFFDILLSIALDKNFTQLLHVASPISVIELTLCPAQPIHLPTALPPRWRAPEPIGAIRHPDQRRVTCKRPPTSLITSDSCPAGSVWYHGPSDCLP